MFPPLTVFLSIHRYIKSNPQQEVKNIIFHSKKTRKLLHKSVQTSYTIDNK